MIPPTSTEKIPNLPSKSKGSSKRSRRKSSDKNCYLRSKSAKNKKRKLKDKSGNVLKRKGFNASKKKRSCEDKTRQMSDNFNTSCSVPKQRQKDVLQNKKLMLQLRLRTECAMKGN